MEAALALCSPHSPQSAVAAAARSRRLGMSALSMIAGVAVVALLVASDSGSRGARSAMLEYYQPWQAAPTPAVNMQQLVGGFAQQQVQDTERGVLHALYRSANGNDDADPVDPEVGGAPSYSSEIDFLQKQSLTSLRAGQAEERASATHRQQQQLMEQEQAEAAMQQKPVLVGDDVLKSNTAVNDSESVQRQAPPGYHLAWVSDGKPELAKENGGRDELPYFPMPPLDQEKRPGNHVEWMAPGPCMLRDGTDMQYDDAECQHHQVVDDQYPERPLLTTTFPSDSYRPDIQYPYIRGPYLPHLVDSHDNQYQVSLSSPLMCACAGSCMHVSVSR